MLVMEMPKRVRSFFLFPCEHPQAEEWGYAEMSQGGPGQRWLHCLPAGLGHPHSLAELVIHYKDPTKPKRLCPPRAMLEMTTSRIDKSQPGWQSLGRETRRTSLTFCFKLASLYEVQAPVQVDGGHPAYHHLRGKSELSSVGTHFPVVSAISDFEQQHTRGQPLQSLWTTIKTSLLCTSCPPEKRKGFVWWTRGVHQHTEQKLTPSLSFYLGRAQKGRPKRSNAVRRYRQWAPWVTARQRDETSLLPTGWHHASTRDAIWPFEADGVSKPQSSYFQLLRSHREGDLPQAPPPGTI